jgi:pullulanase
VPMIFAGDEFADQHDLSVGNPAKQRDAVNYERVDEPFRRRVFDFVARLVKFRTTSDALSVNETDFIHVDFTAGKRVLVWRRGRPGVDDPVVVVANFSEFATDTSVPSAEYVVPNWPGTPAGKRWRDVSQARDVPDEWIGREPIFPWEAKVYATVDR